MPEVAGRDTVRVWLGPERADYRRRVRNVFTIAAVTYGVASSTPFAGWSGHHLAITLLLVAADVGWLGLAFQPFGAATSMPFALVLTGVAGTALTLVSPHSAAVVYVGIAIGAATRWWSAETSSETTASDRSRSEEGAEERAEEGEAVTGSPARAGGGRPPGWA